MKQNQLLNKIKYSDTVREKLLHLILLFLLSQSVMSFAQYEHPLTDEELYRQKEQLTQQIKANDILIQDYENKIAEIALQHLGEELPDEDYGSGSSPGSGNHTIPVNPQYQTISETLSGLSAAITVLGPVGEFIHNINDYLIKKNPIHIASAGWPTFDLVSNIPFVCHLWIDHANGVEPDVSTVQTNSASSYVMMSIDSLILFTLLLIRIRDVVRLRNSENQPLLTIQSPD